MSKDPEWMNKAAVHNALTMLYLSLLVQPLIIFGILYWVLGNGTGFNHTKVIVLSGLAAAVSFLLLLWIIRKLKGKKDNTIG